MESTITMESTETVTKLSNVLNIFYQKGSRSMES
jgi:hypothetical protein